MEVPDIVQETGIKTMPQKKKCKKAKWLSEEALWIAEEKREATGKGEKERYTHLNAEFQRIGKRVKKVLSEQYKELEENSKMGMTGYLFNKIKILREHFVQRWAQQRAEEKQKILRKVARIPRRNKQK